jgi:hypothetical protein
MCGMKAVSVCSGTHQGIKPSRRQGPVLPLGMSLWGNHRLRYLNCVPVIIALFLHACISVTFQQDNHCTPTSGLTAVASVERPTTLPCAWPRTPIQALTYLLRCTLFSQKNRGETLCASINQQGPKYEAILLQGNVFQHKHHLISSTASKSIMQIP